MRVKYAWYKKQDNIIPIITTVTSRKLDKDTDRFVNEISHTVKSILENLKFYSLCNLI